MWLRRFVVLEIVLYQLVAVSVEASTLWSPVGEIGLRTDFDGVIRAVEEGLPAWRAGLRVDDRVDLIRTPFEVRHYVSGAGARIPAGKTISFPVIRAGNARTVTLTAIPFQWEVGDYITTVLQCLAALIFIIVGASLILIRPNQTTWGFGLYCFFENPVIPSLSLFPSAAAHLAYVTIYDFTQVIGMIGLMVFALDFPRPSFEQWRVVLRRALPILYVAFVAALWYPDVATLIFGAGAEAENRLLQVAIALFDAVAIYALAITYVRGPIEERQRLRWVLVGFGVGLAVNYVGATIYFSSLFPVEPPPWVLGALIALNVTLPLTVSYAVIRHRVFDIEFVIGKTLVYAVLTSLLLIVFSVIDWVFGHLLADFRLSALVEALAAICAAFSFDFLHSRIELLIDGILFRRRRLGQQRLAALARALPYATVASIVDRSLIGEPPEAYGLTSSALFRVPAEGRAATSGSARPAGRTERVRVSTATICSSSRSSRRAP